MSDFIVKVVDVSEHVLWEALDGLVEDHMGSYYTLVKDGTVQEVEAGSPHLVYERYEAELYAAAKTMFDMLLLAGITPPASVMDALNKVRSFEEDN